MHVAVLLGGTVLHRPCLASSIQQAARHAICISPGRFVRRWPHPHKTRRRPTHPTHRRRFRSRYQRSESSELPFLSRTVSFDASEKSKLHSISSAQRGFRLEIPSTICRALAAAARRTIDEPPALGAELCPAFNCKRRWSLDTNKVTSPTVSLSPGVNVDSVIGWPLSSVPWVDPRSRTTNNPSLSAISQ